MFNNDCRSNTCSSSSPLKGTVYQNSNIPIKKTIYILDNELRLRSFTNNINCNHSSPNSSSSITTQNSIGRFDELTNFFNIINGLFHQSAFSFGLSTYHLGSLFLLPELNIGVNMNIDQQKIDFLKHLTFYSVLGRQNKLMGIIKFHTSDKNIMLGINYRWSPALTTTFRFGTVPQKRLWSHVEYRGPNETYELISDYGTQYLSSVQFSCLSCLWQRANYQIDGGMDLRITSREKLADIGLCLKRSSNSLVFKCDLFHPLEHYLIGLQCCITSSLTAGLLAEKFKQSIKFSLMSQWNLNKSGLRINTLANTQNELGLALVYQLHHFPLVLQTFGLYSRTIRKCKWGIGLQLLL